MSSALRRSWRTLVLLIATAVRVASHCEQRWDDIKAPHMVADTYHVHLLKINTTEEYRSYLPVTRYQVLIKSDEDEVKFIRFYLTVENENKLLPHGTLELFDYEISRFSQDCPDSIVQTSQVLKDEVSAYWTSPEEGSGCVIFRASIMESPSRWFMDGSLEQKFCQDPKASIDDPGPVLPECCACDEAKYELAFEGLWSRYTHPKNFPSKPWSARFSDVIGASHTTEYRFWEFDGQASEGLKQVAENGVTRILESELKNQSQHIRTIVKARGINFPNITSKTFAMFRVDQQHHVVSLVSMIDPSPDWFVGVSGLELCLSNCSWIEHKELNLYPIDAGTDDGITYESVDAKTEPQDVIRQITTTWPADERSPFYDETAIDMNPLAKLYVKRQRVYEKECDESMTISPEGEQTEKPITRKACKVGPWTEWTPCSVTCGRGVKTRQRKYKNERSALKHKCKVELKDEVGCYHSRRITCPEVDEKKCPLTPWTEWTPCMKTCGPESRVRDRNFKGKRRRKDCRELYPDIMLQQTLDCENPSCDGEEPRGGGGDGAAEEDNPVSETTPPDSSTTYYSSEPSPDPEEGSVTESASGSADEDDLVEAENTNRLELIAGARKKNRRKKCNQEAYLEWSFWSPCSVTCGMGSRSRQREINPEYDVGPNDRDLSSFECQYETTSCFADAKSCEITKELKDVICSQPVQPGQCDDGHDDNSLRYYYDNANSKCDIFHYTGCNGNMNNFQTQQECQDTCNDSEKKNETSSEGGGRKRKRKKNRKETKSNEEKVHCKVSEWSDWSPCYSCKGYRTMSRDILMYPRNRGKSCPTKLIRRQKCHKVLPECDAQKDQESNVAIEEYRDESDLAKEEDEEVTVHCRVSEWGPWSSCSASCGPALRRRSRVVAVPRIGAHARSCPPLSQIEECHLPEC